MPARSKAQLRLMAMKYKRGEITLEEWLEWKRGVKGKRLPERVKKAKRKRGKRKRK